jgi:hypothetical protein
VGFVVEITSRSGRVEERHVFARPSARVGRGYDNDVILADPYVAPHHLQISNDLNGLSVEVLDAAAHSHKGHQALAAGRTSIASGSELVIGRTHLRVYASNHPVPPAQTFERLDQWITAATRPFAVVVCVGVCLLASLGSSYLSGYHSLEFEDVLLGALSTLALAGGWALIWSLVTRVSRGEPRFFQHLLAALGYVLVSTLLDWVVQIAAYNAGSVGVRQTLNYLANGFSLALLLALSLRIAFAQGFWVRQAFAHGIAWSVVAYTVLTTLSFERFFESAPEFDPTIMPDALHVVGTESRGAFVEAAQVLFAFPAPESEAAEPEPDIDISPVAPGSGVD